MKISYNSTIEKKADIEIIENENQISISKVFINWSLEVIGTSHHCNIRLSIDSITAYGTQGEAEEAMEIKILPEHCVITKEDTKIGDDIFPHLITIDCSINTAVIEF